MPLLTDHTIPGMAQNKPNTKVQVGGYSDGMFFDSELILISIPHADRVSAEEMFEEENDPQADSDVTFDDTSSELNPVISSTSEYPNTGTIAQETGEHSHNSESQQPFTFGNGSNIYGEMGVRSLTISCADACRQ